MTVIQGASIETTSLHFSYEGGQKALSGVDVNIASGEFVALVGQNGSGKTTLAKHFNGILQPESGVVLVDGESIAGLSTRELASRIGYCYQNPDHQIFASTVRSELEFGPRNLGIPEEAVIERVGALLEMVGLGPLADSYPFGLSRGERQKVAVASVLAMEPLAVVVDEPTTGLDWRGGREMMDVMQRMHDFGTTVIVITHDMQIVAEYAQRVIVMAHGEKIADGEPLSVFRDVGALSEAALRPPQVFRMAQAAAGVMGADSITTDQAVEHLRNLHSSRSTERS